uniref:NADH-ubiquinone oxidoreductase chain 4L n=1 Tax=Villorita cyprinoides TaxID=1176411 RepID=A0A7L7YVT8_9BIVA|nr:NADH dehydrogenase subunit 4L [Villorita cyprinoides]QOD40734.1 NADH dehydrogenase subunit 4L [Villorita cyprinoides]
MSFFFFLFFLSFFYIFMNSFHFLNILLVFELIVVSLFVGMFYGFSLGMSTYSLYFCIIFLTFAVCESVLGLSILVGMSRFSGVSMVKPFGFMGF